MSLYRTQLPQLIANNNDLFITDGGLETTLIFHDGLELPLFAAFDLLSHADGLNRLRAYYRRYLSIAHNHQRGFILESPTWRASPEWAEQLGYDQQALHEANIRAISLMVELRDNAPAGVAPILISGCLGPRGDGYRPGRLMTVAQAHDYHKDQITTFAQTAVDMVSAVTMNYVEEAIGIALAAKACALPVVISFTVETDGRLPGGQALGDAINAVDEATDSAPIYYMINCAHPTHFIDQLQHNHSWHSRIWGIRANASRCSHAELDEAKSLDDGNPAEFGQEYAQLLHLQPQLRVLGGCCGTDHRHVEQICAASRDRVKDDALQNEVVA